MSAERDRATLELIGIPLDGRSRHWAPEPVPSEARPRADRDVDGLRDALAASRAQVATLQTQLADVQARERDLLRIVQGRMLEAQDGLWQVAASIGD